MPFDFMGCRGRDNNQRLKESKGMAYSILSTWEIENQGASPTIVDSMAASCTNAGYRFV